jgi:hypothetical protein
VSSTNIFAREAQADRQLLAYSMKLFAVEDLAMILPLPVPHGTGESDVRFIDLSGYPTLFDDLAKGYPSLVSRGRGLSRAAPAERPALAVVEVGSFEASFVPAVADFDRLDARFRLPENVWANVPGAERCGFAVFKLKRGETRVHPMALEFPRADPTQLFFPTLHIHDGEVHPMADFDHALFCQWGDQFWSSGPSLPRAWERSTGPAKTFVEGSRTAGIIDDDAYVFRRRIVGRAPNRDVYVPS